MGAGRGPGPAVRGAAGRRPGPGEGRAGARRRPAARVGRTGDRVERSGRTSPPVAAAASVRNSSSVPLPVISSRTPSSVGDPDRLGVSSVYDHPRRAGHVDRPAATAVPCASVASSAPRPRRTAPPAGSGRPGVRYPVRTARSPVDADPRGVDASSPASPRARAGTRSGKGVAGQRPQLRRGVDAAGRPRVDRRAGGGERAAPGQPAEQQTTTTSRPTAPSMSRTERAERGGLRGRAGVRGGGETAHTVHRPSLNRRPACEDRGLSPGPSGRRVIADDVGAAR